MVSKKILMWSSSYGQNGTLSPETTGWSHSKSCVCVPCTMCTTNTISRDQRSVIFFFPSYIFKLDLFHAAVTLVKVTVTGIQVSSNVMFLFKNYFLKSWLDQEFFRKQTFENRHEQQSSIQFIAKVPNVSLKQRQGKCHTSAMHWGRTS